MADDLRDRYAAALTAEHYRRARAQIVASPEEHGAAMADAVLAVRDEELERLREELATLRAENDYRLRRDDHLVAERDALIDPTGEADCG